MQGPYISVAVQCPPQAADLLIAALSVAGYEAFLEQDTGFEAYIVVQDFEEETLHKIVARHQATHQITYTFRQVAEENWNKEWETHFEPIIVEEQCIVRASFHQVEKHYPYQIVINPKMSFGTGHHATTYLMLQWQLELNHQSKSVMDAGCGTGILSIMACQRGAASVFAFDNDAWAIENSRENFMLNHCAGINCFLGTVADVASTHPYHLILANINRNILLDEMPLYAERLAPDGQLLLSGFYEQDAALIIEAAIRQHLRLSGSKVQNDWAALLFDRR